MSRYQLGVELRGLREARGLRLEDVVAKLDVAPSTLSRIETGKTPTRTSYLSVMLDLYDVADEDLRQRLEDLARDGQRKGLPTYYTELLPPGAERYLELEVAAIQVCCFATQLVPACLQTSEYAAHVCRIARPRLAAEQVRALVHLTKRRQEQLLEHGQHELHVVMDEATLIRPVGSPEVMAKQLEHVLAVSASPHVTIQVVPLSHPWPVLAPPFTVLSFSEPDSPDVLAYSGILGQVILTRRGAEVRAMQAAFTALTAGALSAAQSTDLMARRATKKRTTTSRGGVGPKPKFHSTGPMRGGQRANRHP